MNMRWNNFWMILFVVFVLLPQIGVATPEQVLCKDIQVNSEYYSPLLLKGNPLASFAAVGIKQAFREHKSLPYFKQLLSKPAVNDSLLDLFLNMGLTSRGQISKMMLAQKKIKVMSSKAKAEAFDKLDKESNYYRSDILDNLKSVDTLLLNIEGAIHPQEFFFIYKTIQKQILNVQYRLMAIAQNAIIKEDTEALLAVLNTKISGDEIFMHIQRVHFIGSDPSLKYIILNLLDQTLKNPFIIFSEEVELEAQAELSFRKFQNYALWFQRKYRNILPEIRDLKDPIADDYLSFAKFMITNWLALEIQGDKTEPNFDENTFRFINFFARPIYKAEDISKLTYYAKDKFSTDDRVDSNATVEIPRH